MITNQITERQNTEIKRFNKSDTMKMVEQTAIYFIPLSLNESNTNIYFYIVISYYYFNRYKLPLYIIIRTQKLNTNLILYQSVDQPTSSLVQHNQIIE